MRKALMTGALALSLTLAAVSGAAASTLSVETTPVAELVANEKAKAVLEEAGATVTLK